MLKASLSIALGLAVLVPGANAPTDAAAAPHFSLSKSAPAADTAVPSPEEIRLWFTQEPQENSMSIRLVDGSDSLVEIGEPTQDEEDGRVFAVAVPTTLTSGSYTVAWRAIGQDGHVVRGDFSFTVTGQFSTP